MKWWVLKIFSVDKDLDRLCERLDKSILRLAFDSRADSVESYEKIARLIKQKTDFINLRVLCNMMNDALLECERDEVRRAVQDEDFLCCTFGKRGKERVEQLIKKCAAVLIGAGFFSKRLSREYPYLAPNKKQPSC